MSRDRDFLHEPQIEAAIGELTECIQRVYPAAAFTVTAENEDDPGAYLTVTVDVEDTDAVLDVIADRLLEMEVEEGLPIYVIPLRPLERSLETVRARRRDLVPPVLPL